MTNRRALRRIESQANSGDRRHNEKRPGIAPGRSVSLRKGSRVYVAIGTAILSPQSASSESTFGPTRASDPRRWKSGPAVNEY